MRLSWPRLLGFLLSFVAMSRALALAWSEGASHWVIDVATVQPAAWLARQWTGNAAITADGPHLRSPEASLNVLYGCEGTDALMLLASALLVAPLSWASRMRGLLAGAGLLFILNQARLLALFYALRHQASWFGVVHGLVGPVVIVVLVTLFFLGRLRVQSASRGLADADTGA